MDEEEWEIREILSVILGHKISDQVRCAPSNNIRERMMIIIDDSIGSRQMENFEGWPVASKASGVDASAKKR